MYVEKIKMIDLPAVYATAELNLAGRRYLAAASEARNGRAYIIDAETFELAELWCGDAGVMNVVQIPGRNQLLAITRFYPIFQSKEASICLLEPTEKGFLSPWKISEVIKLPYCHRIGVITNKNGLFVLGCQLCHDKEFQEDWTKPGAIWAASIPENTDGKWKLSKVFDGLTKNHGLFIADGNQVYVCSENGVMMFDMSCYRAGESLLPMLLSSTPTSDVWISREGEERIVGAIEPFHGDTLSIYDLTGTAYEPKMRFPIHFGHVIWMGTIFGRSAAIVGNRGGEKNLDILFWKTGETITLDRNVGPTQISVYKDGEQIRILSANHGANEVCLYVLSR